MLQKNTYFTVQLSPLEGYPLTLYDFTSRIKADRLSVLNVKLGYFTLRGSLVFGVVRNCFKQTAIVVSLETPVRNWVDEDVLF